jgi:hypothetical protein
MIELNTKIKNALIEIDFIKRYEYLSRFYNAERTASKERLRYFDGEIVMDSIARVGYAVDFESKDKFFKVVESQIGKYSFGVHIILDNGMVDIVWVVKEEESLLLGLPIGEYSRLIIASDYRIKKPIFGTYEDLDEIFESTFGLFEDFKQRLLKQQ